jgi:hypothetical protein
MNYSRYISAGHFLHLGPFPILPFCNLRPTSSLHFTVKAERAVIGHSGFVFLKFLTSISAFRILNVRLSQVPASFGLSVLYVFGDRRNQINTTVNNSFPKKLIVAQMLNKFSALAKSRDNYHNCRSLHVKYSLIYK